MKNIWSRSVTVTPNKEVGEVVSGTQHTVLSSEHISLLEELTPLIQYRVHSETGPMMLTVMGKPTFRLVIRPYVHRSFFKLVQALDKLTHIFGIHTLMPREQWNPATGEVTETGYACLLCDYEEPE